MALVLMMSACKETTGPNDEDLSNQTYLLMFGNDASEPTQTLVDVAVLGTGTPSLKINTQNCSVSHFMTVMNRTHHFFTVPYLTPGSSVSYELQVNGKTFSGALKMPDAIQITWQPFNPEANYQINWTMASNPKGQTLDYSFMGTLGSEDDDEDLSPSTRSYTINKSKWENLGYVHSFYCDLQAYNTASQGKDFLAIASYTNDSDEDQAKSNQDIWQTRALKLQRLACR